jgi:hypothetical protein
MDGTGNQFACSKEPIDDDVSRVSTEIPARIKTANKRIRGGLLLFHVSCNCEVESPSSGLPVVCCPVLQLERDREEVPSFQERRF